MKTFLYILALLVALFGLSWAIFGKWWETPKAKVNSNLIQGLAGKIVADKLAEQAAGNATG